MSAGVQFHRRAGFLLAALGRRTEAAWGTFLRERGITNSEFAALSVLASESPSQGLLARHMGIDARNAGAVVRRLRGRGWVDVRKDPGDARVSVIHLTPDGLRVWDTVQEQLAAVRSDYFDALTRREQIELERLLNKLNDSL